MNKYQNTIFFLLFLDIKYNIKKLIEYVKINDRLWESYL